MIKISCSDIIEATGGSLVCGSRETDIINVCIDSRKIAIGDLFVPIRGERFDGHNYLEASLKAGAAAVLTHMDVSPIEEKVIIRVEDTSKALKDIAAWYRMLFDIPMIGITGSVGKTSTKDMIACVLEQKYNVLKTQGNFNNEIGLPLTIFNLDNFHEAAVLEMGMSSLSEISRLTKIARPHIALITNIGMSHIENLGSRENILKAKLEILEGLDESGLVLLNGDDELLVSAGKSIKFRKAYYGIQNEVDFKAYNIRNEGENGTYFNLMLKETEYIIHIPVPGMHNIYNALAAIAVGIELLIPMEQIISGIGSFSPGKMRLNIISENDIKIINDAYNASPQSMEAAINVLKDIAGDKRTITVLGDMLEMGDWAPSAHKKVGNFAAAKELDYIITVGKNAEFIAVGAREAGMPDRKIKSFDTNEQANNFLDSIISSGDVILVKGSRGMKMEEIVEHITNVKR